jgi:hypothetical protein
MIPSCCHQSCLSELCASTSSSSTSSASSSVVITITCPRPACQRAITLTTRRLPPLCVTLQSALTESLPDSTRRAELMKLTEEALKKQDWDRANQLIEYVCLFFCLSLGSAQNS